MKALSAFQTGEVICPVPADYTVEGDELVLSAARRIKHGAKFNATIISRFLIATHPLKEGEEVIADFNTFLYAVPDDVSSHIVGFNGLPEVDMQLLYRYADERVRQRAISDGFIPQLVESGVDVVRGPKFSLVAVSRGNCEPSTIVFTSTGVLLPFPLRSTIELPGERHLRLTGGAEFIRHACQPNLRLEIDGNVIRGVALRPIECGEELTYNYLCTEWDIAQPFRCLCNTYSCYGLIRGFRYLDAEQQMHLLPGVSAAIREKCDAPPPVTAALAVLRESTTVNITNEGKVAAQRDLASGTVLFHVNRFRAHLREAVLDQLHIPHSCDANTALLEGRLVTSRALRAGDLLTINLTTLFHELPLPFDCVCGSMHCAHLIKGFAGLQKEKKNRLMPWTAPSVVMNALRNGHDLPCSSTRIEVMERQPMGYVTVATELIPKGTHIFDVEGLVLPFPTVYTVLLGDNKHLLFSNGAQCLAHSCEPNSRLAVDVASGTASCVALRDVKAGEMVSFNYLTTEWDMAAPFICGCGNSLCHGVIKGFRFLDEQTQLRLWPHTTPGVKSLFAQQRHSTLANLDSSLVYVRENSGEIHVARDMPSGVVLFKNEASTFSVAGDEILLDGLRIKHACKPSAVILEGNVVLCQASQRGDPVTLNVNHLMYNTSEFECHCGCEGCLRTVCGFAGLNDAEKDETMLCTDPSVRAKAVDNGYCIRSSSPLVEVHANGGMGQATFAKSDIRKGTRFFGVTGLVLPFPTVYTILIDNGRHLLFAGGAQCLAHSCDPTVRVIVDSTGSRLDCIALRDIKKGELVSFNYLTTEWDMQSPFKCLCGASHCYRDIRGFKYVSDENRQKLWSLTTPAIRSLATAAKGADAWVELASTRLFVNKMGMVMAATYLAKGTVLFNVSVVEARHRYLSIDGLSLRHHCDPTATMLEGQIVLIRQVYTGEELTIDLNCFYYTLPEEFVCNCSAFSHPHPIKGFKWLSNEKKSEKLVYAGPNVRAAAVREGYEVKLTSPFIGTRMDAMGIVAFAITPITADTHFFHTTGLSLPFATGGTVQLEEGRHLLLSGGAQYLCHGCDPNTRVCVDTVNSSVEFVALREIAQGEILTINYMSTEWELRAPFRCLCHSPHCTQNIRGFKYLSESERAALAKCATSTMRHMAGIRLAVQLPAHLREKENGTLCVTLNVSKGAVLMDCNSIDIRPTHVVLGEDMYIVKHNAESATSLLIEGRLVAACDLQDGELLTVNMNLFVYDMRSLFPDVPKEKDTCWGFRHLDEKAKQGMLYLCEPPVRAHAMRDGWIVKSTSPLIEIRPNGDMGQTAFASNSIAVGDVLFHASGLVIPYPTMYTICVGDSRHLLFGGAAECIAHHCDPNVKVMVHEDKGAFDFVAIRPIAQGEMVTFNYCTTEWIMDKPFVCLCGSSYCAGTISGFHYLTEADRQRLWPITSPVIRRYTQEEGF